MKRLRHRREQGNSAIEYAVIAVLVALALITVLINVGTALSDTFCNVTNAVAGATHVAGCTDSGGGADGGGDSGGGDEGPVTPPDTAYLTRPWLPPSWVNVPSGDSSLGKPGLEGGDISGLAGSPLTSVACAGADPATSATVVGDAPSTPGIGDAWTTDSVALVPNSCRFIMHWTRFYDRLGGVKSPSANAAFGKALCRDNTVVSLRWISDTADDSTGLRGYTVYDYGHTFSIGAVPCAGSSGGIVAVGSAGQYSSPVRWQMRWLYLTGVTTEVTCKDSFTGEDTVQTRSSIGTDAVVQATCPDGSYPIRLVVISTPSGATVLDTMVGSAEVEYWMVLSSMPTRVQISEDLTSGQCALNMPDGSQVQLQTSDCSDARAEGILT